MDTQPNDLWARPDIARVRSRVARLFGLHHNQRSAGTQSVWWLGRVPEGWQLVNDVPLGEDGSIIDHLVVGPIGVFTVHAKNVSGSVWVGTSGVRVNGHTTDFVPNLVHEAKSASRLLSAALDRRVNVRPVLAILADAWTVQEPHDDVFIGAPRAVRDWLLRLPTVMEPDEVALVTDAATMSMTWE